MGWTPGSEAVRERWGLDPTVTFLNHGSFGACPREVLAVQERWRQEMEAEPVELLARKLLPALRDVRARVAAFVGADPAGLVLVPNATTGVNAVLWSLDFAPGDEILCADQSYNAVLQTVRHVCRRTGALLAQAALPLPVSDPDAIVAAFRAAITPRTKLLVVDHIVSPTALLLPVHALVALGRERGIPVLVDGAHAPGMVPLALDELGADFYTGNLHKWAYAPKGSAILHLAERWRGRIHPVTTSHAYEQDWQEEFDWTGTFDPTAWLAIPAALDFHASLPGVAEACHGLVRAGRELVADALGVELPHPDDPRLYGTMAIIPFPAGDGRPGHDLTARLYAEHRIEVPFTGFDDRRWVRISAQAYNRPEDYERLADVLRAGWR